MVLLSPFLGDHRLDRTAKLTVITLLGGPDEVDE
jgi:hypothetical protein